MLPPPKKLQSEIFNKSPPTFIIYKNRSTAFTPKSIPLLFAENNEHELTRKIVSRHTPDHPYLKTDTTPVFKTPACAGVTWYNLWKEHK